ncbi:STAS domain-containing protein [Cytobacillus gottheilii]|uniref:STAS domain-containing protein n=1 Tax=Cytobacillus gottheilii TaxID=859144 RepID=A0ABX8F9N9_9BACI|nr:STAS domain-containing protein [Cytobacillus gottheilii]QVY60840.1 STAS domain-containing protein [Cytobacillus gottheilii]
MHRNQELHTFLVEKAKNLTEEWYKSLDKSDPKGVYSSSNPEEIQKLKQQNYDFHLHLCKVFVQEEEQFLQEFQNWIIHIAKDDQHLNTPVQYILREFFHVQDQYLCYIDEFASIHKGKYSQEKVQLWQRIIIRAFKEVILRFVQENQNYAEKKLLAQQEIIIELSSPIITINKGAALLPLVGDIDTTRAKFILEHSLNECSNKGITHLYIDLSGVVMIDTMVAHQIFQLISALKMIGVQTTLSGLRPEVAQTTVQLGLSFEDVEIRSDLAAALSANELNSAE